MPTPTADEPVLLAVPTADATDKRLLRVTEVGPAVSLVQPLDWHPEPERQYPVLVAEAPLPPAAVVLGGLPEDDPDALQLVRDAIEHAGAGGGPSPHIRIVPVDTTTTGLRLRVAATGGGYRLLRGNGEPATADVPGHTQDSARLVVSRLEHIAQWTHLKDLDNAGSTLAGAVTMQVVAATQEQRLAPLDGPVLTPDRHGDYRLAYRRDATRWQPPAVFVRLYNATDQRLWCAVLDLTDRFRVHAQLLAGAWVGEGEVAAAYQGRPIPVTLPPDRTLQPGARGQDWVKLVVSTEQFSTAAFDLPRLDEPGTRSAEPVRVRGIVDRLGLRARVRDLGGADLAQAADWATSTASLVVEVPAD
jgi:hypothetical protein